MLKKWNRFLAFLLAFTMITTMFGSDLATAHVYAAEEEIVEDSSSDSLWEPAPAEETVSEDEGEPEVTEEAEEPSEPEVIPTNENADGGDGLVPAEGEDAASTGTDAASEDATNVTDDATVVEPTDSAEANDSSSLASSEEEATEASSEASSMEVIVEEEEKELPFEASDGGVTVKAVAEPGAFPEGTTMSIRALSESEAKAAADDAFENAVAEAKGADITFYFKGAEIEPAEGKSVKVTMSFDTPLDGDSYKVVHVEDNGEASVIGDASSSGAEFTTDSFSIYVVAKEDAEIDRKTESYTFQVHEDGEWKTVSQQIVKSGDTLNNPGVPNLTSDQEFAGWFIYDVDNDAWGAAVEFGEKSEEDITAYGEFIARAKVTTTYHVVFIGVGGQVAQVKNVAVEDGKTPSLTLNVVVTPSKDTQKFVGWTTAGGSFYEDGATIDPSIKDNQILTAKIEDGFWVYFNENDGGTGGGASYTKPQFVTQGGTATRPSDPTRKGYIFDGWYTTATGNTQFNFSTPINDTTTLYAHWRNGTSSISVIIWKQNVNDSVDATNAEKTYDYDSMTVINNVNVGSTISRNTIYNSTTKNYTGFTYRTFEVENNDTTLGNKVAADGTTVVNVYYDRNKYTLDFQVYSGGWFGSWDSVKTITALYEQNISSYFPITGYADSKWIPQDSTTFSQALVTIDIMPAEDITFRQGTNYDYTQTMEFYLEALPGQTGTIVTYNGKNFILRNSIQAHYNYVTYEEDFIELMGFERYGSEPGFGNVRDGRNYYENVALYHTNGTIKFYYTRKEYNFTLESVYDPTTGVTAAAKEERVFKVLYDALLSGTKQDALNALANITPPAGYQAKQNDAYQPTIWADAAGTVEFDWSKKMPASNDLRAYIVWEKAWYNVKLDFNVDNDLNPETTTGYDQVTIKENQSTDFWVPYHDNVDKGAVTTNFKRDGYELVGWFDYGTNEPYDYGKMEGDVNLYAKWRKIGGVSIVYLEEGNVSGTTDMVTGDMEDGARDNYNYAADSTVVVTKGPQAPAGYTFIRWQLLDKNGDVVALYYPNDHFDIVDNYIVEEADGNKVYLRALYEKTGAGTDAIYTTITYHPGTGTGTAKTISEVTKDGVAHKILVNESVTAWTMADATAAGFSKQGYELIGWNINETDAANGIASIALGKEYIIADNDDNPGNPKTNTLYAVWKAVYGTYQVNYYKGSISNANYINSSTTYVVPVNTTITLTNEQTDTQPPLNLYKPDKGYEDGRQANELTVGVDTYDDAGKVIPQVVNVIYDPIEVVVTVKGKTTNKDYNGSEQTYSGYEVVEITGDGYTQDDFQLKEGKGIASGTDAGTYEMGLQGTSTDTAADTCSFENTNENFTNVTFIVQSDGSLTIDPLHITVEVTGEQKTFTYDGNPHKVEGFTAEASNSLYDTDAEYFVYEPNRETSVDETSGKPYASRTNSGTTNMFLKSTDFSNTSDNFIIDEVTVTDGKVTITGSEDELVITIVGDHTIADYDGDEHSAAGYTISFSSDLFTEDMIESVYDSQTEPSIERTDVGTTNMNLSEEDFPVKDDYKDNFSKITYQITDGYVEINPLKITVTVNGDVLEKTYDGNTYRATGYSVESSNDDLFDADNLVFTPAEDVKLDSNNDPYAEGKDADTYNMGLDDSQFALKENSNFEITEITVNDGYLEISPLEVEVTITGDVVDDITYDGLSHKALGYEFESNNPLYTESYLTYTPGEKTSINANGKPYVERTDAGKSEMYLDESQFVNSSDNFTITTLTVNDGYVEIKKLSGVTVTIKGKQDTVTYNGESHTVSGYTATTSEELYDVEGDDKFFTCSNEASITETDVKSGTDKKYMMELVSTDFTNTNDNFEDVTFTIEEDGYLEINPLKVGVRITGNHEEESYDGQPHTAKGFKYEKDHDLYNLNKVSFTAAAGMETDSEGNPTVTATDVKTEGDGKYYMGLKDEQFENSDSNFEVTFTVVADGFVKINPIKAAVTITGATDTVRYTGQPQRVTGYTVSIPEGSLYTEDDFTYTPGEDTLTDDNGDPYAEGTTVDTYEMGLAEGQFENTNDNFSEVDFTVNDGSITIIASDVEVIVTITAETISKEYDGNTYTVTGYTAVADNDNYDVDTDFEYAAGENTDVNGDGVPYVSGTDAGEYKMNLASEDFTNVNTNFETVTFVIEQDGLVTITPKSLTVTITGKTGREPYTGKKQTLTGYEVDIPANSGYSEEDFELLNDEDEIAEGTAVGTYDMNLSEDSFQNNNENYDVTFAVTNGALTIEVLKITVNITGDKKEFEFDFNEHEARGYTVEFEGTSAYSSSEASNIINFSDADIKDIYSEDYIFFDFDGDEAADTKNDAVVTGTLPDGENPKEYPMGLTKDMFANINDNFEVEFVVVDGNLTITPVSEKFKVTVKTNDVDSTYNGKTQKYKVIAGVKVEAENGVQKTIDTILSAIKEFFSIGVLVANAEDGDVEFKVNGNTVVFEGAIVEAEGKEVDSYPFEFASDYDIKFNGESVKEQFEVTVELGSLNISPATLTITADDKSKYTDEDDPTWTYQVEGFVDDYDLPVFLDRDPGDTAGQYAIHPYLGFREDQEQEYDERTGEILEMLFRNYDPVNLVDGTLTISNRPSGGGDDPTPPTGGGGGTPTTDAPAPAQAVLGARREEGNGQAVLGARRGGTDDMTNTPSRVVAIIVAAAIAATLFVTSKKKKEEEEG